MISIEHEGEHSAVVDLSVPVSAKESRDVLARVEKVGLFLPPVMYRRPRGSRFYSLLLRDLEARRFPSTETSLHKKIVEVARNCQAC